MEFQQRRAWAFKVVQRRVVRPLLRQHQGGRSRHQVLDSFEAGPVPGLPGWTYLLNTDLSALKNERLGEEIYFDAVHGPGVFHLADFCERVFWQREPGVAAGRLRTLFQSHHDGPGFALEVLLRQGLIDPIDEVGCAARTRLPWGHAPVVRAFLNAWSNSANRVWLGCVIGDWIAVEEAGRSLGLSDLTALAAPRAEACRRAWLDLIRREADACLSPCALDAVASYRPGELPQYLERALADPETLSDTAFRAMALIKGNPSWCTVVFDRLVQDLDTEGLSSAVPLYATYLLEHDFRPWEVLEHLLTAAEPPCGLSAMSRPGVSGSG
jgi:hypothetical protein